MDESSDLLTVREVAQTLRVDKTTVRRWIKDGVLEAITLPHRGTRQAYRIRRSTLDALLAQPAPPPTQAPAVGANSHGGEVAVSSQGGVSRPRHGAPGHGGSVR
jgi:excisionase family DNA binding protein